MAQLAKGNNNRLRSISAQFQFFLLFTMVFGSSFIIFCLINITEIFIINNRYDIEQEASYTIKTEGCTIPGLTALDDTIKEFNRPPTKLITCPIANYSLVQSNETHIWINMETLKSNESVRNANISCCYQSFYRPNSIKDVYSNYVDDRALYNDCIFFSNNIQVNHEFVRVICDYDNKTIYKQYFLFARKKDEHKKEQNTTNKNESEYYNVIVMGMDSISRLNFYRTMPNTLAYLKDKGAIELLGYNKVDDNTFPNLIPMLLGIKESDLKRTCWPTKNANLDNCPFIWQWFKEAGFQTALGEDVAKLGTFNYIRCGFIRTPTDYYIRTFMYEAEKNVGNNLDFNSYICMGSKFFYKVLLDYIYDLTGLLKDSKLFGFFWEVSMSHDHLTYPMAMDASYESFLKRLDSDNYLNKTVLILLSDHGMRWGKMRLTKQGRLEERLPFVYILLPPSFKKNYNFAYKNLKTNSKRLTTPYDIHATLSDLITLEAIKDENIKQRTESFYAHNKSVSLFLPIPGNRTCSIAGIDDQWCTCHKSIKISIESFEAHDVAEELVKSLNNYLEEHEECAKLTLSKVLDVTEMMVGEPRKNEVGWREFMAVVRTTPGDGVFEGTLRKHKDKWSLAGAISRLNLYGDQSHCVHHYQLKLYCYCR